MEGEVTILLLLLSLLLTYWILGSEINSDTRKNFFVNVNVCVMFATGYCEREG